MPETVEKCPLCGLDAKSPFDQRQFRGTMVTNILCRGCGLVYQSPRMTAAESQEFYEEGYRRLYQGQESPISRDLAVQEARARLVLDFLGEQVRPGGHILDIGCSAGILLTQLQTRYQAQVRGVEPGKMYREYARAAGLPVYHSLEALQQEECGRFDLISMMHVLEHLPDPLAYLLHLRERLLETEGLLLLEVPNLYAHDCFEVAHLVSYSPHTLSQLVEKAGYKNIKMRAHGLPRSRLIPLYLTILAQPSPVPLAGKPMRKEAWVKQKRQLGLFQRKLKERFFPRHAWLEM
jgi:2-polyprenyl-3-methyl-5-hydroxy-6-metoxy-1,4-benzoquinol methylase